MTYDIAGTSWENFLLNSMVTHNTYPPFKTGVLTITFGIGFDKILGMFDLAVAKKVIQKRGSWFSYNNEQIGQGRTSSVEAVRKDQELFDRICKSLEKLKFKQEVQGEQKVSSELVSGKKKTQKKVVRPIERNPVIEVEAKQVEDLVSVEDV